MATKSTTGPHVTPELFKFLGSLKRNNNRDWFNKNKSRFEEHVRDSLSQFIDDCTPHLQKISPYFTGSALRIYRDTRFSKDKSPYKTYAAVRFGHDKGKGMYRPVFYLHLDPNDLFIAAGIWQPDTKGANKIRQNIVDDHATWKRIINAKPFKDGTLKLSGESLKGAPRGFDKDHPLVDDLKRKDFITVTALDKSVVTSRTFLKEFIDVCKKNRPFMKFVTEAVGFDF